jgi:hypothetical protein
MDVEDFFKTGKEIAEEQKEHTEFGYALRIIKRHFEHCVDLNYVQSVARDRQIDVTLKLDAIKERADEPLRDMFFAKETAEVLDIIKKGSKNKTVKRFVELHKTHGARAMVFPMKGLSNWVIHIGDLVADTRRKTALVIPGFGISITIQRLETYINPKLDDEDNFY